MNRPSEYLKIKYAAQCKCGNCQLVPRDVLRAWDQKMAAQATMPSEQEIEAAASAIDNIYFVPGVPHKWAKDAAALALTAAAMARAVDFPRRRK